MLVKMREVVFDTNLVIDFERANDGAKVVKSLVQLENKEKLKIHIPVIVASEFPINKQKINNFYLFKKYMQEIGFKNLELLKPIGYLGMCFLNFMILPKDKDSEIIILARDVHSLLFPGTEFDHRDFCIARNIDYNKEINPKWRNRIIDTLILWSVVYYDKKTLVTRDKNFYHHKNKIKSKWGVEVMSPEELLIEVEKCQN